MQEMIPGHLISRSLTEQATNMYQVAEEIKSSEGLKGTVPDAFFFIFSDDNSA